MTLNRTLRGPLTLLLVTLMAPAVVAQSENEVPTQPATELGRVRFVDVPVPLTEAQLGGASAALSGSASTSPAQLTESQASTALNAYTEAVTDIESSGGAWDQALVEELTALGSVQQARGDHQGALATLRRAMHVNRIHAGLHTLEQVPVVEAMIDSHTALGNWGQVDLYQQYLYFIQHRAYGVDDPRFIPVMEQLGRWHIEAFTIGVGEPLGLRLVSAQMLFSAAKRLVGTHFGRNDRRYVSYLRHVARSSYLAAQYPDQMLESDRPEFRTGQERLRDQLGMAGYGPLRGFASGAEALQEIVDYHEQSGESVYLLAEALTNLADWQLMFQQRNAARQLYLRAWQLLAAEQNSEELLQRLFGQVIPIPTFAESPTNLMLGSGDAQSRRMLTPAYIDVRLNVTSYGAARQVEVLSEETEANAGQFSQLRREIRDTLFRPMLKQGVPVNSEGHLFRYRYWY